MLRGLEIRDMLIIDQLELAFEPGLNVLTGETGAGKSILLDCLGFVLGWRGRAELVRSGAQQGEVVAWFDLPPEHAAHQVLEQAGLPDDGELILRRVNGRDGRKTAWVNDRRCSGEVLRALSETLVELHGQHDDRGLLNPRGHRDLLDQFAGLEGQIGQLRKAWRALAEARKAQDAAQAELAEMRAEEEFLRHAAAELETLHPEPGEEAALDTQRRTMQGAERIRDDIAKGLQALGLNGAEGAMSDGQRWLEGVADQADGALDPALESLARAQGALSDAVAGVEQTLDALAFNPHELEEVEERLFAIRALARKHGVLADALPAMAEEFRTRLTQLDRGDANMAALQEQVDKAQENYETRAAKLSKARATSAAKLDKAVRAELAPLKMERAVFTTEITPADPGPEGHDAVSFTVATNPGAPSGPLAKIASGGELSRFLLALKVCLSQQNGGVTMIFDEIDRGVGGATADAVGRRLAELSDGGQVLVVTHSPQVAALGTHHLRVEKHVKQQQTRSTVVALSPQDRVDEIARMVSGDSITEEARGAARALLAVEPTG